MCFDSCWPGKLLCTRRSERHMKPSTWVSITWAFFERPQQIKFWFKWIRHVLGMRSDKVSWNCRVWGTRHFNNHDPWGWIEPPFKSNLYHEQWTFTTSNEPQQYQYVRIPVPQVWTPLVTYDSMKMRRQWTVTLGATTPSHTVSRMPLFSFLDTNSAAIYQPNNISIKRVAMKETFQWRCFWAKSTLL